MWRLTGIGLLAIGVGAAALYGAGRLIQPSYAFSMLGARARPASCLRGSTPRRPAPPARTAPPRRASLLP